LTNIQPIQLDYAQCGGNCIGKIIKYPGEQINQ